MTPAGKAVEVVGAAGVALVLTDAENAALNRPGINRIRQLGSEFNSWASLLCMNASAPVRRGAWCWCDGSPFTSRRA